MDREYALDADSARTTEDELQKAEEFLTQYVLEAAQNGVSAFDIKIGDTQFAQDIGNWTLQSETTGDDDVKTDYTLTYTKDGRAADGNRIRHPVQGISHSGVDGMAHKYRRGKFCPDHRFQRAEPCVRRGPGGQSV